MEPETKPVCDFPDCGRPVNAKKLCVGHYSQQYKGQQLAPLKPRSGSIPADVRFWSKVDKSGDCWIWHGSLNNMGYGHFLLNRKLIYAHRYSYIEAIGPIPEGLVIDHICGTPRCVRPNHLRATTQKLNSQYRVGLSKNNKSGYRGVHQMKNGKWRAMVTINRKHVHVGVYGSAEEAAVAARNMRDELGISGPKESLLCA